MGHGRSRSRHYFQYPHQGRRGQEEGTRAEAEGGVGEQRSFSEVSIAPLFLPFILYCHIVRAVLCATINLTLWHPFSPSSFPSSFLARIQVVRGMMVRDYLRDADALLCRRMASREREKKQERIARKKEEEKGTPDLQQE